jgi:hypothetical protein
MPRPVKRLSNMEIDEISTVDKMANQHAKRAPEEETMPELYDESGELLAEDSLEDGQIVFDEEGNAYQFSMEVEDDEAAAAAEADARELEEVGKAGGLVHVPGGGNAFRGTNFANRMRARGGNAREYLNSGAGKQFKRRAGIGAGAAGAAGAAGVGYSTMKKSFTETVMEELSKAYSDEDRDQVIAKALGKVEEIEQKYAEAEEIAKSERELRLTREYISKAADYNVPVEPEKLGPVLLHCAEKLSYEDCEVIHKALSAAGEVIFEEKGFIGGGDNVDIMSQVEAQAVEIGKSASPENIQAVFDNSPEAYDQYLASRRGN